MREIIRGAQFKRDVKRARKRGKDLAKLRELILLLAEEKQLPPRYKDHPLVGEWQHHRDSHIEPDWLLLIRSTARISTWSGPVPTPICSDELWVNSNQLSALAPAKLTQQLLPPGGQHHVRRSMSLDLAVIDHHYIGGGLEGFCHIMRDVKCGNLPLRKRRRQMLHDGDLQIRIKASEWLVQQQQRRFRSERARQGHALPLATRKIRRHPLGQLARVK
jgi:mRNA interferase YafQ